MTLGWERYGEELNQPKLYEVPAHQWADMTAGDGKYGVTILNDCKYGWDHPDYKTLRLTLIHTPGVFENWSWVGDQGSQDLGHHEFRYALVGHQGDWRESGASWEAARFNQPLMVFQTSRHEGFSGREFSLLKVIPGKESEGTGHSPIMVNAVKMAEQSDEIVIRVRELDGRAAENARIQMHRPIIEAREINGAEENIGPAEIIRGELTLSLSPYQPKAFAIKLADDRIARKVSPACKALNLPFNLDGVSLDSDRKDGNFDDKGNSIAGELLPDTLEYQGISFVLGPKTVGAANVVSCTGQIIDLPAGKHDRLYLFAAAVGGPAVGKLYVKTAKREMPVEIKLPDYAEPIGQWNNRLVAGGLVEEPEGIAPAYINRLPVGWYGSHRHTNQGENEAYRFTYLYLVRVDLPAGAKAIQLPDNPRFRVMAATAAKTGYDKIRSAQPLYDEANNTLVRVQANRKRFVDSVVVNLSSPIPGANINYTLDGSEPMAQSPVYEKPLVLEQTTTVKSRAFLEGADDSHITSVTFTRLIPRSPEQVENPAPGLKCLYFEGEWTKLPNFNSLKSVIEAVVSTVALQDFTRKEDYGLVFSGYIKIPKDGLYDFFISSDDGSLLVVGDSTKADNDGIHGSEEVSCDIALKAGLQPIKIYMFQAKGGQALELMIQGPDMKKQVVPSGMYYHK